MECCLKGSCFYDSNNLLLSRQTESVRDHKFPSGYAHSSMDKGHFISHLHQTERDSGVSQSLRFSQMPSEMRLCLFLHK